MKKLATLVLTILCLTTTYAQRNKKIKGNGNIVTIDRTTSDYDALRVGGFYKVELVEGTEGKITIKGEDNILEYVETEVKGGTLTIKTKNNMNLKPSRGRGVYITVPVEKIDVIRLSGAGKVFSSKTLQANNFKVHASGSRNADLKINASSVIVISSGSSNIELSGTSERVNITSSGSSNLRAYELNTDRVDVRSSGSSNVQITVNEVIEARASGSSNVRYKGSPEKVRSKASGSGKVSKS